MSCKPYVLLLVPFVSQFFVAAQSRGDAPYPNIVIILVDDLGWTDLACYGSDFHETPHIDRFSRESLRFTNAYAAASICSPTRASIMTGKYPARLHMTIWHEGAVRGSIARRGLTTPKVAANLPHAEVTLAEVLKQVGYATAHVGKWHLGTAAFYPETQGFDSNTGGTFWGAPATFFYPYRGLWPGSEELRYVPGLAGGTPGEYLTDRLTTEAMAVVETLKDRPFLLNVCFHTVHTPIEGKPDLVDYYTPKVRDNNHHRNPTYAAMVHSLDENVGRLLDKLKELRIDDRTVVILSSDNGGLVNRTRWGVATSNAPLRSGKGSLYEGGIRVPLIIRWPGVTPRGEACDEIVGSHDFYPTILEMLQLDGDRQHNEHVDGVSLAGLLSKPTAALGRDAMYWHYPHYYATTSPVSAVRNGRWKLLYYYEDMHVELYNLEQDLGETKNLAKQEPIRAGQLRNQLRIWLQSVDAQLPSRDPKATRN